MDSKTQLPLMPLPTTETDEDLPQVFYLEFAHVGITATRKGITGKQRATLIKVFQLADTIRGLVHGCATGGDSGAHEIFQGLYPEKEIHGHPGNIPEYRNDRLQGFASMADPLPPLSRNHTIVANSEVIIGMPAEMEPQARGGTWSTVRLARRKGKPLFIIYPDGSCEFHLEAIITEIELSR